MGNARFEPFTFDVSKCHAMSKKGSATRKPLQECGFPLSCNARKCMRMSVRCQGRGDIG
jgi:hypothetical protein